MHIFNKGKACSNISISSKPPMFGHGIKTMDADVTQNIFALVFPMIIMLWFFSYMRLLTAHHTIIFQQIISTISFELWSHTHEMVFYPCQRFGMQCLQGSYFRQSDIIETNKQRRQCSLTHSSSEAFIFSNFDLISMATTNLCEELLDPFRIGID